MLVDHAVLADGYVALGPLDAVGIFVGIPVIIIAVVVTAVYASTRRAGKDDGRASRSEPLPPLTEPVLGSPRAPQEDRPDA